MAFGLVTLGRAGESVSGYRYRLLGRLQPREGSDNNYLIIYNPSHPVRIWGPCVQPYLNRQERAKGPSGGLGPSPKGLQEGFPEGAPWSPPYMAFIVLIPPLGSPFIVSTSYQGPLFRPDSGCQAACMVGELVSRPMMGVRGFSVAATGDGKRTSTVDEHPTLRLQVPVIGSFGSLGQVLGELIHQILYPKGV